MKMRNWVTGLAVIVGAASAAWGAGFSASTIGVPGQVGGGAPEGGSCGAITLTHSASQTITALNSVSCNNGGLHANNSYFRAYDMSAFLTGFDVCAVNVGIETASGAGGTQPITVNIYANSGALFPGGTLTLVGTAAVSVADQALTVLSVPLTAGVPAGALELVVEVFTPDGQVAGNSFFIGSNNLGETGPSYIQAADCGITTPVTTGAIQFPNMQIVLDVIGNPAQPQVNVIEVPTLGGWGLALLGAVLAGAAVVALRRRSIA